MENRSSFFWTLVPPRGDGRLPSLQWELFRKGILNLPPAWAFLPLDSPPGRQDVKGWLPLRTGSWVWDRKWLGLQVYGMPEVPTLDFPPGVFILGRAERLPDFPPPILEFSSLRVQKWSWRGQFSPEAPHLEVEILEDFRVGRS